MHGRRWREERLGGGKRLYLSLNLSKQVERKFKREVNLHRTLLLRSNVEMSKQEQVIFQQILTTQVKCSPSLKSSHNKLSFVVMSVT